MDLVSPNCTLEGPTAKFMCSGKPYQMKKMNYTYIYQLKISSNQKSDIIHIFKDKAKKKLTLSELSIKVFSCWLTSIILAF